MPLNLAELLQFLTFEKYKKMTLQAHKASFTDDQNDNTEVMKCLFCNFIKNACCHCNNNTLNTGGFCTSVKPAHLQRRAAVKTATSVVMSLHDNADKEANHRVRTAEIKEAVAQVRHRDGSLSGNVDTTLSGRKHHLSENKKRDLICPEETKTLPLLCMFEGFVELFDLKEYGGGRGNGAKNFNCFGTSPTSLHPHLFKWSVTGLDL